MSMLSGSLAGNDFDILAYAASGMEAQRGAMNIEARNLALAQTATPGSPAKALEPVFSTDGNALSDNPFAALVRSASIKNDDDDDDDDDDSDDDDSDSSSGAWDAARGTMGTQGLVAMTGVKKSGADINSITQMVDIINAQRAYEANASVFDLGKTIASKTIDLEKS